MADITLPPVGSLSTADDQTLTSILDLLFEPSPEIHRIAIPVIRQVQTPKHDTSTTSAEHQELDTYADLIKQIGDRMFELAHASATMTAGDPSSREQLHSILGSHPRLGAKKVDSALSRAEQSQLNTDSTDSADPSKETEAEALARLNAAYEVRFPGLRYVVFVNGRGRDVIMENMKERIDRGDIRAEEREGVQAMIDIALDRAKKILSV